MPNASSTYTQVAVKQETTYGVLPGAASAASLRRVSVEIDLEKDTYESNEQRDDLQVADMRHGARKATGKIVGELSCGSYADWFAGVVKRDWSTVANVASLTITIASAGGGTYTIARSTGDYTTEAGLKVGSVWQINTGPVNAINLAKRFLVLNVTTLSITVIPLNNTAMFPEGPIAGCALSMPGKRNFVPLSGHINKSFAVEKWFSDVAQSEVYTGIRPTQAMVKLPGTGLATVEFAVEGQNMVAAAARYFTSPAAASGSATLAAVNGICRAAGVLVANITGFDFTIASPLSAEAVVGSNTRAEPFSGRVRVSGNFTALFDTATLRDAFIAETEIELVVAMTGNNLDNGPFMAFQMPRCKIGKVGKSDQTDAGVVQSFSFTALLQVSGGSGTKWEQTTLLMQDSNA